MRSLLAILLAAACGHNSGGDGRIDAAIDGGYTPDACEGLACFLFDCSTKSLPPTTITGRVFAPNGTLPLYGVDVYVPQSDPGPLASGAQCTTCSANLQGGAYAQTRTDENGYFRLEGVPATTDVPLVVQIGKWRRQITIPNVAACQELALPVTETRLPRTHLEGDIPQIAMTTGSADALECLVYRLGIDISEFTSETGQGRVHLYANLGITGGRGTDRFLSTHPSQPDALFTDAQNLWATSGALSKYDIVMLSCEGSQNPATKPQTALQAMHDYADLGGRLFMSHWHNIWIGGASGATATHGIPEWQAVATWNYAAAQNEATQLDIVDETVPKGMSFATWLLNVGASTTRGQLTISQPRYTCSAHDPAKSERWVYVDPLLSTPLGKVSVQDLLFTTPQSKPPEERCGKVVFSDMHVSSGSSSLAGAVGTGVPFPSGCSAQDLTAQEKALAFMFFDISSCVGQIF